MGTSLTGKNISASYLGLLKSTDNLAISTSAKTITDGAGNDLPIKLSTAQFLVSDGSVSAPSIGFSNETNTGFYHTTGEINATIAGTNKITIDGSQTHIKGSTLLIDSSDDSGILQFNYGPATNSRSWRIYNDSIADGDFSILFSDTRTSTSYQTALNINKDGNIALGGGSASSVYDISLGGNTFITASNTTALKINRGASYGDILELQSQGGVFAQFSGIEAGTTRILKIDGYDTDSEIRLSTSGSNRFIIDTNGNVRFNSYGGGTITGTATQRLGVDLNGNVIEIPIGAGAVDGAGATGQASFWTDSDTISGDDDFYWDNTNKRLGIATTSPTASLQIENTSSGNATVGAFLVNSSTTLNTEVRLAFASHTNSDIATNRYSYISTINTSGSNGQDMIFATNATGAGGSEAMRIDSSGRVGINEDNPETSLHVEGTIQLGNEEDLAWAYDNGSYYNYISNFYNTTDGLVYRSGSWTGTQTVVAHSFETWTGSAWDKKLAILQNGNVGINETNPLQKLHVNSGSGNSPAIFESTDLNSQIWLKDSSSSTTYQTGIACSGDNLIFNNGGEKARIDASGNVGIGTQNPSRSLTVYSDVGATNILGVFDNSGTTATNCVIAFSDPTSTAGQFSTRLGSVGDSLAFYTNGANERLRITSGGDINVNYDTSIAGGTQYGFQIAKQTGYSQVYFRANTTDNRLIQRFYNTNSGTLQNVGNISISGSATTYATSSDYRLKENVVELTGALDRISQLKPSRFNFIADAETTVDGFLAHEVQDIVPEAIVGEKDATEEYEVTPEVLDDEGNVVEEAVMGTRDVYQGIDQSKLVPLLVASIQELKAEIDELKKNI